MCLILFAINASSRLPLVLAANRDEFYKRPTAPMGFWEDAPDILAGRDLEAGGTWMGVGRSGRFAALTNYRDMKTLKPSAPSRGMIIPDLLTSSLPVPEFLKRLDRTAGDFNGFNLIAGHGAEVYWYANMDRRILKLPPGIHGLSNHLMDTPWPKVTRGKAELVRCIEKAPRDEEALFNLLLDRQRPGDHRLPDTGIGLEWERILSPLFIESPTYGTRSATVMQVTADGNVQVTERTFPVPKPETSSASSGRDSGPPEHVERRFTLPRPSAGTTRNFAKSL